MPVSSPPSSSSVFPVTPLDLIKGSLQDLGVVAGGQTVDADDANDARMMLNFMLDSWATEGLLVDATLRTTKALSANVGSYSIGSGASIDVIQPVFVERAMLIAVGATLEQPLRILTTKQWAEQADKTTAGTPSRLYFQKSATGQGTIYLYFIPDAAHTLVLYLPARLASIASDGLGNPYALLPGYADAIRSNLAVRLAPSYEKVNSPSYAALVDTARSTKANLKRVNLEPIALECDPAILLNPVFNIFTGEPQ